MKGNVVTAALGLLWLVLIMCSVLIPYFTAPTDFGFTAGLNRVTLFFQFQIAAALPAIVLFFRARRQTSRARGWLLRMPGVWAVLLVLGVFGLVLWAGFSRPPPGDFSPPGPVTKPAEPRLSP